MANDVRIHVTVQDDASPTLGKIKTETDGLSASANGAGASMLSMGVGIAAVTAAAAAAAGIVYSFYATNRDLELQLRKSTTVFAEQLPVVQAWADANASAMGLTSNEATRLAASMADLFIPMGMTREAATKMATETVGLAGALAEWSGGQRTAAEVAAILQKAFLGETDGLKELGVAISAEQVMAELAKKGQEDLTGSMLEQAKAVAIQKLVFEKSVDAQTAYAEGAGTAARAQAELTAHLVTAHEQMSQAFAPVISAAATALVAVLVPAIDGLVVVFKLFVQHGTAVAQTLGAIVTAITVFMIPKLVLLTIATYAYVVALTAKFVALAAANPALLAAGAAAGLAAAAAIGLAIGTARGTVETEKNKNATDLQTAATNAQAESLRKATEAADTHSRSLDKMTVAQLAAQFAANEMSGVPDPRVTADIIARAKITQQRESGTKSIIDDFMESISGEKAKAAAPPAFITSLQNQILTAYVQGGIQQVAVVKQHQGEMMEAVSAAAAKMSSDLGITLPDATQIMFDRMLEQEKALAAAQEQIANANMQAQIEAYLKGGQAAVDIVKIQQADTAVEISKMAASISEAFGITMPEAIGIATKQITRLADAMRNMTNETEGLIRALWKATNPNAATAKAQADMIRASAGVYNPNMGSYDMSSGLSAAQIEGNLRAASINAGLGDPGPATKLSHGGIVRARPGGTLALLGEGGRNEAVIPLGSSNGIGSAVNIYLSGVITDPVATGKAIASALNSASRTTGPLLLSGTVQ